VDSNVTRGPTPVVYVLFNQKDTVLALFVVNVAPLAIEIFPDTPPNIQAFPIMPFFLPAHVKPVTRAEVVPLLPFPE